MATGDVDPVVEVVYGALLPHLPLDTAQVRRLAGVAVDAMLPDGAVLTEQCGVLFADPLEGSSDRADERVSRVGDCELAERITAVGPDQHVHRFVLVTPWRPPLRRPPRRTRPRPRPASGSPLTGRGGNQEDT